METPAQAGQLAAKLFFTQTWVSLGTAVLLLVAAQIEAMTLDQSRSPSLWVLTGLLLSILVEFVAVPHIMARDNLMLWHSAASVMYLLQWGCAGKALWDTQASGA